MREAYLESMNTTSDPEWDEKIGPEWVSVIGDRTVSMIHACEFGLAEETIACLIFDDGTCEVGIGECMRPYSRLYLGSDPKVGFRRFMEVVVMHTTMMGE